MNPLRYPLLVLGIVLLHLITGCTSTEERVERHQDAAVKYLRGGELAGALLEYQEIVRLLPDDARARNTLASLYYQLGDREKAVRELNRAIRLDPQFYLPQESLANIYLEEGRYAEARDLLLGLSTRLQEEGVILRLAQATALLGESDQAIRYLQEGLSLYPRSVALSEELARETEKSNPVLAVVAWDRVARIASGPGGDGAMARRAIGSSVRLLPELAPETMRSIAAAAREAVRSGKAPEVEAPQGCASSPVGLSFFHERVGLVRGYGDGGTLRENIERAARSVGKELPAEGTSIVQVDLAFGGWIPIEIEWFKSEVSGRTVILDASTPSPFAVGVHGLRFAVDDQSAVVFPGDPVRRGDESFYRVANNLRRALGVRVGEEGRIQAYKFFGLVFVERAPGSEPVPLLRMGAPVPELDAAAIEEACRRGLDWLVANLQEDGSFRYQYNAVTNRMEEGYNLARHAGTTLGLFEGARELGDERYREAAQKALDYLMVRLKGVPGGGGKAIDGFRLGPTALTLLASLEGDVPERILGSMGRFILGMQAADGRFLESRQGEEVGTLRSRWAASQSILALVRLHRRTGDKQYIDAARRAAEAIVDRRDADEGYFPDHWLVMAIEELHQEGGDRVPYRYALRIAEDLAAYVLGPGDAPYPDWVGGFSADGTEPKGAASLGNLEAIVSAYRQSVRWREPHAGLLEAARLASGFALRLQYRPEDSFYLPAPEMAIGGFRQGLISPRIRIDGIQHAVMGLLGLRRILLEETPPAEDVTPAAEPSSDEEEPPR